MLLGAAESPRRARLLHTIYQLVAECNRFVDHFLERQVPAGLARGCEVRMPQRCLDSSHDRLVRRDDGWWQRLDQLGKRIHSADQPCRGREPTVTTGEPHQPEQVPGDAEWVVPVPTLDQPLAKVAGRDDIPPSLQSDLTQAAKRGGHDRLGIKCLAKTQGGVESLLGSVQVALHEGNQALA